MIGFFQKILTNSITGIMAANQPPRTYISQYNYSLAFSIQDKNYLPYVDESIYQRIVYFQNISNNLIMTKINLLIKIRNSYNFPVLYQDLINQ